MVVTYEMYHVALIQTTIRDIYGWRKCTVNVDQQLQNFGTYYTLLCTAKAL